MNSFLLQELENDGSNFFSNRSFGLRGRNRNAVHDILARMTDYIEVKSGHTSKYTDYIRKRTKTGYQVEHVWADKYDRHKDEFGHIADFYEWRNRIGGLLLLENQINASLGSNEYNNKVIHYVKQNLLAQSFSEIAYENSPGFNKFIKEYNLDFIPHVEFKLSELEHRQNLYLKLAENIWDPQKLNA